MNSLMIGTIFGGVCVGGVGGVALGGQPRHVVVGMAIGMTSALGGMVLTVAATQRAAVECALLGLVATQFIKTGHIQTGR